MSYKISRFLITSFIGIFALLGFSSSHAQLSTDSFTVTALVEDACQIEASDYNFGTYNPLLPSVFSQNLATVMVTCSLLTPYTVELDDGVNDGGSGVRTMVNTDAAITANNELTYSMSCALPAALPIGVPLIVQLSNLNATGCLLDWRDGAEVFIGLGLGPIPLAIPLVGTIPANQNVAGGTYQDTLVATITY